MTDAQVYLSEVQQPEPLSVCQLFGEELGSYHNRIDNYEIIYMDLIRRHLPSPHPESAEENFLVFLLYLNTHCFYQSVFTMCRVPK